MTTIFGILNVTTDSFSDGGKFLDPSAAIAHGRALVTHGADVLDIGAAASNPKSQPVSPALEIERLEPVVAALGDATLSIDSCSTSVQSWALSKGVAYLNDIQGFADQVLYPRLASSPARLIVMHSVQGSGPATEIAIAANTIVARVIAFFDSRLAALASAGIGRDRIILDPGMGFFLGSDPDASFAVLRALPELSARYHLPLLVSVSRKSFLRHMTGRQAPDAGAASLAAELFAIRQGAAFIRTHDPGALRDALTVNSVLAGPG